MVITSHIYQKRVKAPNWIRYPHNKIVYLNSKRSEALIQKWVSPVISSISITLFRCFQPNHRISSSFTKKGFFDDMWYYTTFCYPFMYLCINADHIDRFKGNGVYVCSHLFPFFPILSDACVQINAKKTIIVILIRSKPIVLPSFHIHIHPVLIYHQFSEEKRTVRKTRWVRTICLL